MDPTNGERYLLVAAYALRCVRQVSAGGGNFLYAKRSTAPFTPVHPTTRLGSLNKFFELNSVAFVTNDDGTIRSVVTKIDLLTHLATLH